jgi:hypothetical protein
MTGYNEPVITEFLNVKVDPGKYLLFAFLAGNVLGKS